MSLSDKMPKKQRIPIGIDDYKSAIFIIPSKSATVRFKQPDFFEALQISSPTKFKLSAY